MPIYKLIIVLVFLFIVWTLASACYNMVSKKRNPDKMFKMLAWRIALSVLFFAILMLSVKLGWIKSHNPFPKDPAAHLSKPKQ